MRNVHKFIVACAILIAALTLLIPLNEIGHGDNYADEGLADDSLVLGEEENKPIGPLTIYYSLDGSKWIPIPIVNIDLKYVANVDSPLDLSGVSSVWMKVEANSGYTFDQNTQDNTLTKITTLSVCWQYSLSGDYKATYEVTSVNTNATNWIVPIDTLGPFNMDEYLSFTVSCTTEYE